MNNDIDYPNTSSTPLPVQRRLAPGMSAYVLLSAAPGSREAVWVDVIDRSPDDVYSGRVCVATHDFRHLAVGEVVSFWPEDVLLTRGQAVTA